ncbi:MAG: SPOR domain-containing protein [Candidatus Latescibacteria bacterium]|nr:SPOR domain-containing protein [Candidatus Latescibacterota bacterium]
MIRLVGALLLLLVAVPHAWAEDWTAVERLFREGDYATARTQAVALAAGAPRSLEGLLWNYRLATDPVQAAMLREKLLEQGGLDPSVRRALLLDAAWTSYAQGEPSQGFAYLPPQDPDAKRPQPASRLLAGLLHRAAKDEAMAGATLEQAPDDDPELPWIMLLRGRKAAAFGDPGLARSCLGTDEIGGRSPTDADVLAARWQLERDQDARLADRIAGELERAHPRSPALDLVRGLQQRRLELALMDAASSGPEPPPPSPHATDDTPTARYVLQLGAFGDRGRALAFVDRWRASVPGLHLVQSHDARGQLLHKVRAESYSDQSEAAASAAALSASLGLAAIVVDTAESP